jgi:thiamine transport system ATP-binding protein
VLHLSDLRVAMDTFLLSANWTIPTGAKVAIIGASGSGKSSLLQAIAGFLPVTGHITWNGQDITKQEPGKRPISILFQDQNLFPHLTIARNLALGLSPILRLTTAQWTRVDNALARVGLPDMGTRKPAQLSGGQIGRAALARALLRAKPLLLLDEPFAALGPALKADMLALVDQVVTDTSATLLMVTHDPDDARHHADLTVFVHDGIAQPPTATADLFANPPPALLDYLGNPYEVAGKSG